MAKQLAFAVRSRVALKEDTKVVGVVMSIYQPYNDNLMDSVLYSIRWDKHSQEYFYLEESLVGAK